MKKIAFDNQKYLKIQRDEIMKRIAMFGDKLYLEFGGKLFDDFHAERVLPGFAHDTKLKMLLGLKKQAEIVIVVNSADIQNNKVREDLGLTYEEEVIRLIKAYREVGLYVGSVVLSQYKDQNLVKAFRNRLENLSIKVYIHYCMEGYPQNIPLIVSEDGLGKNDYIETERPLVVITAPGPGSGKMATCLSQLYHEHKRGIKAGYAKFETFPIWNIPIKHPINLAYESATLELNDINMIDPYHLEAYGKLAVNYNRDVEAFPLLKKMFEMITGECPYNSPTDMGVNMIGYCISNEEVAIEASKQEIIRRYYAAKKNKFLGKYDSTVVDKASILLNEVNAKAEDRKCVLIANQKAVENNTPYMALELSNKKIITGKTSSLLRSPAALVLNCLKHFAKIDESLMLISPNVIEPIQKLKTGGLGYRNPRLHLDEMLIALPIAATSNPIAELALSQLPKLKGLQAHSNVILSDIDLKYLKRLGIQVTEDAIFDTSAAKRLVK